MDTFWRLCFYRGAVPSHRAYSVAYDVGCFADGFSQVLALRCDWGRHLGGAVGVVGIFNWKAISPSVQLHALPIVGHCAGGQHSGC